MPLAVGGVAATSKRPPAEPSETPSAQNNPELFHPPDSCGRTPRGTTRQHLFFSQELHGLVRIAGRIKCDVGHELCADH